MVIHDTECPYWDQVSLNSTNQTLITTISLWGEHFCWWHWDMVREWLSCRSVGVVPLPSNRWCHIPYQSNAIISWYHLHARLSCGSMLLVDRVLGLKIKNLWGSISTAGDLWTYWKEFIPYCLCLPCSGPISEIVTVLLFYIRSFLWYSPLWIGESRIYPLSPLACRRRRLNGVL